MLDWLRGGKDKKPHAGSGDVSDDNKEESPFRLAEAAEYPPEDRKTFTPEDFPIFQSVQEGVQKHFEREHGTLPAFPVSAMNMTQLLEDPDAGANKVAQFVSRDPALSAVLLRVANSAYYAGQTQVQSVREAVVRLGTNEARNLAAASATGTLFDPQVQMVYSIHADLWQRLWLHAMTTAFAASAVALQWNKADPSKMFLIGLLHDIGKVFALRSFTLCGSVDVQPERSVALATVVMEGMHTEFGSEVASSWRLPEHVTRACAQHHLSPLAANARYDDIHLLRVVSGLNEVRTNPWFPASVADEMEESIQALKLKPRQLRTLLVQLKIAQQKAETVGQAQGQSSTATARRLG